MKFLKRNYGWFIVAILASLPLLPLSNILNTAIAEGITPQESEKAVQMLYHITGEFSIRWMTAVLTCTPFYILFGVNNLFVRQSMGIATAIWSILHFVIFIWADGFLETFTQVNYIAGFIALLILIPLMITSNRKSMKYLKKTWKKLQSFVYLAVFLSLLHIAILEKTYLVYAIIVGLGFMLRIPNVKSKFIKRRSQKKV